MRVLLSMSLTKALIYDSIWSIISCMPRRRCFALFMGQLIKQLKAHNIGTAIYIMVLILMFNIAYAAVIAGPSIVTLQEKSHELMITTTAVGSAEPSILAGRRSTVTITAYSSTPDQTDETPFITASGKTVHDGIVAANFLPFGTKVQIPKIFGEKIFVVEDRMSRRFDERMDIWFPDRDTAIEFGIKQTEVVVL